MSSVIGSALNSIVAAWCLWGSPVWEQRDERGQTTAEYALVLLVAGLIVGVFAAFVRSGSLTSMFHTIVSGLINRALG